MADPAAGPPGLFITGTDTGVGKTVVTAALARLLRRHGNTVAVCKPVATGAAAAGGRLVSDDTLALAEAEGGQPDVREITPWTFADPVAPPLAARRQGVALQLDEIVAAIRRRAGSGKLLLVEGVGGLLCPLTEQATVADLVRELGLPLVVVARNALGALNHTLLTLEVAAGRGLPVVGVVVSETAPPEDVAAATNVSEMRQLGVTVLAVVPHLAGPAREAAEQAADALGAVPWEWLATGRARGTGQGT